MIKSAVALSTVMALGAAGAAFAQSQPANPAIDGTIQSVDPGTNTVVLDDGQTYTLGDGAEMGALREGSRVTLSCDDTGANCMVMSSGTTGLGPGEQSLSTEEQTEPSAGTDQGKGGGGPSARPTDAQAPANDTTADDAAPSGSASDSQQQGVPTRP